MNSAGRRDAIIAPELCLSNSLYTFQWIGCPDRIRVGVTCWISEIRFVPPLIDFSFLWYS